ncbi:MAG: SsrA-binding protein SmpB [Candidatus Margulisiibacteriota bacterium]
MAKTGKKSISLNKKAFHDYLITERMEAGVVLEGCEVKSIRSGQVTIRDAYARFFKNELWLFGCHITAYKQGPAHNPPDPERNRKLLMHRKQLNKLMGRLEDQSLNLIPLELYFLDGKVKLELGLGKSKKQFDKRAAIKEREIKRELDRAIKRY